MTSNHFATWSPGPADPFDARQAAHLLRRTGFGSSPDQVASAVKEGMEASVEALFTEDSDGERLFAQTFEAIAGSLVDFSEADRLRAWWTFRMVKSQTPFREKIALFWHGHFATSIEKVESVALMNRQIETLRSLGLGNFRDIVIAMSKDPAMLVWLDGESSTKLKPNENFGRELMELFTLGIGHYTEADVQAAAHAFTGWNRDDLTFVFKADEHDSGRKTFLGKSGRFDGGDIIDILIQHPATARRVATKLVQFFACPEPSAEVIDEAAAHFERTRLDVKWFLRDLFQSRYFYSKACHRTRISSPAEFVVGTVRTLGVRWSAENLSESMKGMGQSLLAPPNVKGWDGEGHWINSSTWAARTSFSRTLAELENEGPFAANLDINAIVPTSISEPAEVVDRLVEVLLQGELAAETRRDLIAFLLIADDGQPSQAFREDEGIRRKKTRGLLALILALPEYHAC